MRQTSGTRTRRPRGSGEDGDGEGEDGDEDGGSTHCDGFVLWSACDGAWVWDLVFLSSLYKRPRVSTAVSGLNPFGRAVDPELKGPE